MFWIKRNWENRIKSSLIHSVMCWAPCVFKWSGMNHHPSKVCMIKPFLNLNWIHAHQRPHPISFISTGVASHLKVTSEFVELDDLENSTLQCSMISADILIAEVLTGLQIFAVDFYPEGVGIFAGTRPLLLRVHHFWVHLCIHSKFLRLPRVVGVRESMGLLVIISADLTPFLPCLPFSFFSFPSRTTGSIIFLMAEALGEQ